MAKPNYAERYMKHAAVRNAIKAALREHFPGAAEPALTSATDAILAIDPDAAYAEMMKA